ncbi:MAG: SUMF1/EgtB/PvdO family nonheme iron enzyme, partial [Verrucomicrobiota bacterium]
PTPSDDRVSSVSSQGSGAPADPRLAAVKSVFPGSRGIEPVLGVQEGASFRVTIEDGRRFLAWVVPSELGGLVAADKSALLPDTESAKQLRHPQILPTLHVTGAGGFGVLVTEDFDGEPLMNRLGQSVISYEEVSQWFEGIGGALEAMHEAGVLHRGLSPAGILVNEQGEIRIVGAGFANVLFDFWTGLLRPRGRRMLDYLPGELQQGGIVEGKAHCDLFSLGVIVYEGLTGGLPKGSFAALPSQKAGVPTYVDDAVLRAMHGTPEERPQSFQEFREGFVGQRIREDNFDLGKSRDGDYRHREDRYSRGQVDGLGSWLMSWQFKFGIVLAFLTLAAIGWIIYEQQTLKKGLSSGEIEMVSSEVLLKVEELMREGKTDAAVALLLEFAEKGEVNRLNMQRMFQLLIEAGRYGQAEEAVRLMASRASKENPEHDVIVAMADEFGNRVDRFLELDEMARVAKAKGDFAAEQRVLAEMKAVIPEDRRIAPRIAANPLEVAKALVVAIDKIKALNEGQKEWHYHLSVTAERARLNLSGNTALMDISPLEGLVLHELDLSNTGVGSIAPLAGVGLRVLRLDGSQVMDLQPVAKMSRLEVLTFRSARVESSSGILENLSGLRSVLGTDGSGNVVRVRPPVPGQQTWIDGSGRTFRALPGYPVLIAELEESSAKEDELPRTSVSFEEATKYCQSLTKQQLMAGAIGDRQFFRLPTDFEWSLAARLPESPLLSPRGRRMQPVTSGEIDRELKEAVVFEISEGVEAPPLALSEAPGVGRRGRYRELGGFRDMLANAGEWVKDEADSMGDRAIVRGVVGANAASRLRLRTYELKDQRRDDVGFRLVLQTSGKVGENGVLTEKLVPKAELAEVLVKSSNGFVRDAVKSQLLLGPLQDDEVYRRYFLQSTHGLLKRGEAKYLKVDVPMTWRDARVLARKLGGDLVCADDRAELGWLREKILQDGGKRVPFWLGGTAKPGSNDWRWSRGDAVPEGFFQAPFAVSDVMGMLLVPDDSGLNLSGEYVTEAHSFVIKWGNSHDAKVARW